MSLRLASHNDDLARLIAKGYAVAVDVSNHLVVRDVPYLDAEGKLCIGAIVAKIVFVDQDRIRQDDHQISFAGSAPHELDGQPIKNLGGGATTIQLSPECADVVVERSFSNKPAVGSYADFFAKIENYVAVISGPAMERYGVSPYTFRSVDGESQDPIFKFRDTLTSRAEIGELAERLEDDTVAIIGLGGTGAYLLDYLVKTRVKGIRGFDGDDFHIHNAYRAPGRTTEDEFGKPKAAVLQARYENFRHGLDLRPIYIDETSADELAGVTFALVCVDKGSSRARIFDLLINAGVPYIDVGMGLNKKPNGLSGSIRTTYFPPEQAAAVRARGYASEVDEPDNIYRAGIQISELNALNAAMAATKYKQLRSFYRNDAAAVQHIFNVAELKTYEEGLA